MGSTAGEPLRSAGGLRRLTSGDGEREWFALVGSLRDHGFYCDATDYPSRIVETDLHIEPQLLGSNPGTDARTRLACGRVFVAAQRLGGLPAIGEIARD